MLFVVLALVVGAPLATAQPRSAIPWLSDSIALPTAPIPPRARPAGPARPETATITVTTLAPISRDAVGVLAPEVTGLPRSLWGDANAGTVRAMIVAHPDQGVPAARALFRRLLLAEADPPRGADASASVLLARIDRLLDQGALDEAAALIDAAGPETPEMFRRWFDIGLLTQAAQAQCQALRRNPALSPTLPARVFCLARGGDWNAAEITLTLGEDVGSITPDQEALLARFLDPAIFEADPEPPIPEPLTALDFTLREAIALPRPYGPLPLAFLRADLDEHAPMRARIDAGERLVLAGAAAPDVLFAAYRAGAPAASGGVWERARAVQALDAALASPTEPEASEARAPAGPIDKPPPTAKVREPAARNVGPDPVALADALAVADAALAARGLRVALATEYGPALAALDPARLAAPARADLTELLLLAGDTAAAARAAGPDPEPRVRALLSLAGSTEAAGPPPEDPAIRAALSGLADRPAAGEREARLAETIAAGRTGEAILDALVLLEPGPAVDPASLETALFTLRTAGQGAAARAIALQTLLLPPGG